MPKPLNQSLISHSTLSPIRPSPSTFERALHRRSTERPSFLVRRRRDCARRPASVIAVDGGATVGPMTASAGVKF